jgi:hypothetical protein
MAIFYLLIITKNAFLFFFANPSLVPLFNFHLKTSNP